jgi:mannose-6-phosphate isomerase-like protein (cupin superfamily)
MVESTFLSGKVAKHTLPVIQGGAVGARMPPRKRLMLSQGELAEVHDGAEEIRYLAIIELRAGGTRGNHYHKVKQELVYVIEGELLVTLQDPESGMRDSLRLEAGELAIIPPGVAHARQTILPGKALEFSPARFDPADTYRFEL